MGRSLDSDESSPDDGKMEERFNKVEQRLAALERDVAEIRANYVTREYLDRGLASLHDKIDGLHGEIATVYREINSQTWKLVTFVCGFGTAIVTATFFIATHVK